MSQNQIKWVTPQLALVILSGTQEGREVILADGETLTLGRGKDVDIVVDDTKASRRHTRFVYAGGQLHIEDLGSINGTFVNGAKVEKALLFAGDSIEVANVRIKVEARSRDAEKRSVSKAEAAAGKSRSFDPTMGNVLSGPLNPARLREMLRFLHDRRRTGALIAHTSWGTGRIYLREGVIYFANITGAPAIPPLKALQRLLRSREGSLEFSVDESVQARAAITVSLEELLQAETDFPQEIARLEKLLRHADARLEVNPAKARIEATPTSAGQIVLKLVADHGTLAAVMDHFSGTDIEAVRLLIDLIEQGHVRAVK